jgi:hypothetical protein
MIPFELDWKNDIGDKKTECNISLNEIVLESVHILKNDVDEIIFVTKDNNETPINV